MLYIVPTPIGNLSDITLRARETLQNCDFVAAEDTRVGGKLLMLLGVKKPLVSFHEHSPRRVIDSITARMAGGESCALITDAGTPAVSDPGEKLVAACVEAGIPVCALPGACAATTALSASGLPGRRFCFEGFLPEKASERADRISELTREKRTFIIYVAPHDITQTLAELAAAMGERRAVLAKELTKLHERYFRGTLREVQGAVSALPPEDLRGEYVLTVEGMPESDEFWKKMTVAEHVEHYIALGLSKMDACKQAARDRGVGKGEIYAEINR